MDTYGHDVIRCLIGAVCLFISFGCSETPTGTVAPSGSTSQQAEAEEPVDMGDENGPAISKPLEEPAADNNVGSKSGGATSTEQ